MNKALTLEKLAKIRKNHIAQTDKISTAVNGRKVSQPTALSSKECEFGEWLYDKENHLKDLLGSLFFEKLEALHEQWHKEYAKAYKILFEKQGTGLLSKFRSSPKIDSLELDKAKVYYTNLDEITSELLKILKLCEQRISALNENKFIQ